MFLKTCAILCALCISSSYGNAQSFPVYGEDSKIAVLDRAALFNQSKFGRFHLKKLEESTRILDAANKQIEKELEAEEAEITELRKTLSSEEFQKRALAFDEKVNKLRQEQVRKSRNLTDAFNKAREKFVSVFNPLLQELIEDQNIEVLLAKETVIAFSKNRDITNLAINLMDQRLAE